MRFLFSLSYFLLLTFFNICADSYHASASPEKKNQELSLHDSATSDKESHYVTIFNNYDHLFLIDQDTQEVLFEKNPDAKISPSSMTKLMTAYVIFDHLKQGKLNLQQQCLVGNDAWRKVGSTMFLNHGDKVSIDELLTGLLVVSGNDASITLAKSVSEDVGSFADVMNRTAKIIGLKNSNFKNPHGLNKKGHYMTLRDLAILATRIRQDFPEYMYYFSIPEYEYGDINQHNRNPLMKINYPGVTGMKTGHTDDGGYGMVATASRNNRNLIAVVNNLETSQQRGEVAKQLLDYGFDNFTKKVLFKKNTAIAKVNTWLGNQDELEVVSNEDIVTTINNKYSSDDVEISVKYQDPLYAPIIKGQEVATLMIKAPRHKAKEFPLFAKENIDKAGFYKTMKDIGSYYFSLIIN